MSNFATMNAWEIACEWYRPDEIRRCVASNICRVPVGLRPIPRDVSSDEFAEWLTEQYRLAMAKGIQIGRGLE